MKRSRADTKTIRGRHGRSKKETKGVSKTAEAFEAAARLEQKPAGAKEGDIEGTRTSGGGRSGGGRSGGSGGGKDSKRWRDDMTIPSWRGRSSAVRGETSETVGRGERKASGWAGGPDGRRRRVANEGRLRKWRWTARAETEADADVSAARGDSARETRRRWRKRGNN